MYVDKGRFASDTKNAQGDKKKQIEHTHDYPLGVLREKNGHTKE